MNHQIFHFPGAEICLGGLTELRCNLSIEPSFFFGLVQYCRSIEKLIVEPCTKDNYGLAKLIEVQENLKHFEYVLREEERDDFIKFKEISQALMNKSQTIIHFEANYDEGIVISPKIFPKLLNLRILRLIIRSGIDEEIERQLEVLTFFNLQEFRSEYILAETVTKVIEKTGGKLQIIVADYDLSSNY